MQFATFGLTAVKAGSKGQTVDEIHVQESSVREKRSSRVAVTVEQLTET